MRRYEPHGDELVVVRLSPGEEVTVATAAGSYVVHGERPSEHAMERVALVPFDPAAIGWGGTLAVVHASGRSTMASLRRILRGHRLDEDRWELVRRRLREAPDAAVYVRHVLVPHYNRTRLSAIAVRYPL